MKKRILKRILNKLDGKDPRDEEIISAAKSRRQKISQYDKEIKLLRSNIASLITESKKPSPIPQVSPQIVQIKEAADLSAINEALNRLESDLNYLKSVKPKELDFKPWENKLDDLRAELLRLIGNLGGGNANRRIRVNGTDVLSRYTDINLVGSIAASNDDINQEVDLDFSAVGGVDSVSNVDGTLTISPTTGNVIASLNLSQANTWLALQTFGNNISLGGSQLNVSSLSTNDILQYNGSNWVNIAPTGLGLVNSVSNSDGTLTISPTSGSVVASINEAHNFDWAGTHTFNNSTFYLSDSSYDTDVNLNFGNIGSPLASIFSDGSNFSFSTANNSALLNITFPIRVLPLVANYHIFGSTSTSPTIFTPSTTNDTLIAFSTHSATGGGARRAFSAVMEWSGTSNGSGGYRALNGFFGTTSTSTANLTSTNAGGQCAGRYAIQPAGSGTISMTSAVTTFHNLSGGTVTEAINVSSEGFATDLGTTITRGTHFWARENAGTSGTFGTQIGFRIDALTSATTNLAMTIGGTGLASAIYFNATTAASTEYIYSSAASTLDLNANTTVNLRIGTTAKLALTTSALTFADAVNMVFNTTTGTKIGTATTQKIGFWNATPVVQNTGWSVTNVTTDRSYDANSTTLDEIADVLGTLIDQLKTYGILGA